MKIQDLVYTKVVDWFNTKFNFTFSPKSHEILSGIAINISENSVVKFTYCLLFAKYHLYYQKMYSKRCNIDEFFNKDVKFLSGRFSSSVCLQTESNIS